MRFLRWFVGQIILLLDALTSPRAPEREKEAQEKVNSALEGLEIYEFRACPFCVKVRRYMKGAGMQLPLRDAKEEPYRSELVQGGGKYQVPCLKISGAGLPVQWMYESSDIIAYLDQRVKSALS